MNKRLQNDHKHTDKRDPKKAQTICRRDHVEYTQTDITEFLICNSTRQTIGQVNRDEPTNWRLCNSIAQVNGFVTCIKDRFYLSNLTTSFVSSSSIFSFDELIQFNKDAWTFLGKHRRCQEEKLRCMHIRFTFYLWSRVFSLISIESGSSVAINKAKTFFRYVIHIG